MAVREPLCSACAFPTASLRASQTGRSPVEKKVTFDFLEGISAPGMKNEVGGLPSNVREMYYMKIRRFFFDLTQRFYMLIMAKILTEF